MSLADDDRPDAPGSPGIPPTWTSSAKDFVGCALGPTRLWFTLGFGIVNEVYYPRVDLPQIRDLGFIVADGAGFWSEVKRVGDYRLALAAPGVPAVEVTHRHERYTLRLRIAPDPRRDVLAIECRLEGDPELRLYALLAPHLGGTGRDNRAAVARHRGHLVLWAEQGPFGVALAAANERQRDALRRGSAGYVGFSDGWQDFAQHGRMTWEHPRAGPGNVAAMGELPRSAVLALAFGSSAEAAATLAFSSLMQPFENLLGLMAADWSAWHARRGEHYAAPLDAPAALREEFVTSSVVLRSHLDRTYPGAMVASLGIPWGDSGEERSGYQLVWPRDLVECAGALLVLGAEPEARDTLRYLVATQEADGHWQQNQFLGGMPYWRGIQLDETGFPVLLAAALEERDALRGINVGNMARRALSFIVRTGPGTDQDRWEENAGINTFTLAVTIGALVAGAAFLEPRAAAWALAIADFWNASIERWTVAHDTALARELDLSAYYVRVAPVEVLADPTLLKRAVPIRNRTNADGIPGDAQIATDFLQLVRFGLRRPDDPVVLDSVRAADALLRTETPNGPVWHRYAGDGYGEHDDGSPFDGTGRGRGWPLLTGERGHYELIAGRDPLPYLAAMAAMASPGGMIPEQVWDADPIPARRLFPGRPTGSAMPLAWAHAEFIKLMASLPLGHARDRPRAVWERYGGRRPVARHAFWWPHAPIGSAPAGALLAVALPRPAIVRWSVRGEDAPAEAPTEETGLGFHVAVLPTAALAVGARVEFTWRDTEGGTPGRDYEVAIVPAEAG